MKTQFSNITIKKGTELVFAANPNGHYSDKQNRAAKLAQRFTELEKKFYGIAERGIYSNTEHSRCAIACLLMMNTGIRIGNEASAEGYYTKPHPNSPKPSEYVQTFGLTTLRAEHVETKTQLVSFDFTGKKQIQNQFQVRCKLLASWIKHLKQMEMQTLLGITDSQLTRFIKKYVGKQHCPKDFRTMRANIVAGQFVRDYFTECTTKKEFNGLIREMYETVSSNLGNTPGVCKKSYVAPALPEILWDEYFVGKSK